MTLLKYDIWSSEYATNMISIHFIYLGAFCSATVPVRAKAFLRALRQREVVQLVKGPVPHQPSRLVLHGIMAVIWQGGH